MNGSLHYAALRAAPLDELADLRADRGYTSLGLIHLLVERL